MTSPGPLTIAFLIATPGTIWGGMEKHTADLAGALANRGHSIHVLGHRSYRAGFPANVIFHTLPLQLGRHNLWLRLALHRCLRQLSPDIVHAQGNKAAQLAARTRGPAAVKFGTVHGIKSSHKPFDRLDRVIAVSPQVFRALKHPRKSLVYNGVDISPRPDPCPAPYPEMPADQTSLDASVTNVIAVGRLEPVKGFDVLIKAWAMLGPEAQACHLTIFGDGSQRQALTRQIRQSGLEDHVTLAGFCPNMAPVYEQARLTVISSEREGFSYILAESLLHGCPVISTPVSVPRDLLPAAMISDGYSARALADLLTRSLTNLDTLKDAEQPAMIFAAERLTIDAMVAETEKLYFQAMGDRPAKR